MRVIVTGSQTWKEPVRVWEALDLLKCSHDDLIIRHGKCPRGADMDAHRWCARNDIPEQTYAAYWGLYGPKAGPLRNQRMVDDGADLCLAFFDWCKKPTCTRTDDMHPSHGTEHCVNAARAAGIEVIEFWTRIIL